LAKDDLGNWGQAPDVGRRISALGSWSRHSAKRGWSAGLGVLRTSQGAEGRGL